MKQVSGASPRDKKVKSRDDLAAKMTPDQIAEAQRMAREWKRLGASGKSRSECALAERAAQRTGTFCLNLHLKKI